VTDLDSQRKLSIDAVGGLGVLLGRHFAVLLPTMLLVKMSQISRFTESRARISHVLAKLEVLPSRATLEARPVSKLRTPGTPRAYLVLLVFSLC
jgi:hypothetical protein